jgi:hypothetical protein
MAQKEDFIGALIGDNLPEGFVDLTVPELSDVTSGSDLESSAIEISKYCANMNEFLKLFVGVKFGDYLLRGMQRSPGLVSLVLSSLRNVPINPAFRIISPAEGAEILGYAYYRIDAPEAENVLIDLYGGVTPDFVNGLWEKIIPLEPQAYTDIAVSGEIGGEAQSDDTSYTIDPYQTVPTDGGTEPATFTAIIVAGASIAILTAGYVKLDAEDEVQMSPVGDEFHYEFSDLEEGAHTIIFRITFTLNGAQEIDWSVNFTVSE